MAASRPSPARMTARRGPQAPPGRDPPFPQPGPAGRRRPDGVTKGRVCQIEQGKVSGNDVLARYAAALGGRLHRSIYFDDGDTVAIA